MTLAAAPIGAAPFGASARLAGTATIPGEDVWQYVMRNGETAEDNLLAILEFVKGLDKLARNKTITDPTAGTMTVYEADGTTVFVQGDLFEDAGGTTPYRGQGADRRERLA